MLLSEKTVGKEKDKVTTSRINENTFETVERYTKDKGLTASAHPNSVVDSHAL
jgi:hypothetical protein